jgi:PPOX class probable F420-dependent enzyme
MKSMSRQEWRAFLLTSPRTAKAATVRLDGRPHIAPVWFDLDGDDVIFTTWHTTVKARDLQHDPRISLCVDDERPPFSFVLIEGTARLNDDLDEVRAWATRIAGRYLGLMRARRTALGTECRANCSCGSARCASWHSQASPTDPHLSAIPTRRKHC